MELSLSDLIPRFAHELAHASSNEQSRMFNAFAHELFVACAADNYKTQQQLCYIAAELNAEGQRVFGEIVAMLPKIEKGFQG